jgi:hypothetical protein
MLRFPNVINLISLLIFPFLHEVKMKFLSKLISQLLIASMILLPFSTQAGMIGTDQAISSAKDLANVDKVRDFVSRADVAKQFELMGLTTANAQDRVNAMTQEEINRVAGQIDSLPAGASSSGWWWAAGVIVVGLIIWYAYK